MGVKNNAEKQEDNRSSEKQSSENKTPNQSVENPFGINNQGVWLDQASKNLAHIHPAAVLTLQRKAGNRRVQRIIRGKEDAALTDNKGQLKSYISNEIKRAQAGGQPLDKSIQRKMDDSFGHDFSGVRIHTDARSDNLNRQLQAKAFTLGNNIFFSSGAYNPSTPQGKNTLQHELTHVVQQGGKAPASGPLLLGGRDTSHEKEAEQIAAGRTQGANSSGEGVQRQPASYSQAILPSLNSGTSLAGGVIQRAGLWDRIKTGAQNAFSGIGQKISGLFSGNTQQAQQQVQNQTQVQNQPQGPKTSRKYRINRRVKTSRKYRINRRGKTSRKHNSRLNSQRCLPNQLMLMNLNGKHWLAMACPIKTNGIN